MCWAFVCVGGRGGGGVKVEVMVCVVVVVVGVGGYLCGATHRVVVSCAW